MIGEAFSGEAKHAERLRKDSEPTHTVASNVANEPLLPLIQSFLIGVEDALIGPLLAFNSAVWKFREPSHSSHELNSSNWLINRVCASVVFDD